jgi:hypothetical protein
VNLVEGKARVRDEQISGDGFLLGLTDSFWLGLNDGVRFWFGHGELLTLNSGCWIRCV